MNIRLHIFKFLKFTISYTLLVTIDTCKNGVKSVSSMFSPFRNKKSFNAFDYKYSL